MGLFLLGVYVGYITPVIAIGAPVALCYTRQGSLLWRGIIVLVAVFFVSWFVVVWPFLFFSE